MKINNASVVCFKVFVSKEYFMCIVRDTESNHEKIYEISKLNTNNEEAILNELDEIRKCFSYKSFIFCGYNNNHYDNAFINYCFVFERFFKEAGIDVDGFLLRMNNLHNDIINGNYEAWKEFKYGKYFRAFDLMTMNFSKKERISLQELKFSLHCKSMLSPKYMTTHAGVTTALRDDNEAIIALLNRSKSKIDLRLELSEEYNFGTLSLDDVSLGKKIFSTIFAKNTGKALSEYEKPSIPEEIKVKDIILPCIKFTVPFLVDKFESIKQKIIHVSNPELEERFSCFGSTLSFGLGGLHSIEDPKIYKESSYRSIVHIDAESAFPNILTNYRIYPKFLGDDFFTAYMNMLAIRIKSKNDGNEDKNKMFKRILVATVGMFNNQNDPMYDPVSYYTITINVQFLLLMLAERLFTKFHCNFIQWNTDGLFIEIGKFTNKELEELLISFRNETKVNFKTEYYEQLYQLDCNNYFGVKRDWAARKHIMGINPFDLIVGKGVFKAPNKTFKASNANIIFQAIMAHFLFDKKPEDVIKNAAQKSQQDFMLFSKVPESYKTKYGEVETFNTNRYYYSKSGKMLWKQPSDSNAMIPISDKGYPVKLCNVNRTVDDIDVNYYICRAKTIIAQLTFIQLKMF